MPLCIDRCVCHETLFEDLKAYAAEHGITDFKRLWMECDFGKGCGMCRPYVHDMLQTGTTAYDKILRGAPDPLIELGLSRKRRR